MLLHELNKAELQEHEMLLTQGFYWPSANVLHECLQLSSDVETEWKCCSSPGAAHHSALKKH